MTKWNPTLLEDRKESLNKTIEVPEILTNELWQAALEAKIQGTKLTLADWVGAPSKKDCEDIGIPWPELAYDRQYEVNQNLYELLIRTMWNAIVNEIKLKSKINT